MTRQLSRIRKQASRGQAHRCFYCNHPMWLTDVHTFAEDHRLTLRQAKLFQCTAEHLRARQDGGDDRRANIVAACATCNRRRHQRRVPLDVTSYLRLVRKRVAIGRWHAFAWPNHAFTGPCPAASFGAAGTAG